MTSCRRVSAPSSPKRARPWLLLACCLLAGCGGGGAPLVQGKVTIKGQPVTSGLIGFSKTGDKPLGGPINPDGTYELSVPPGDYKVRIDAPSPIPAGWKEGDPLPKPVPRQVPEKYAFFESSNLTATVNADGDPQTIDFSLD